MTKEYAIQTRDLTKRYGDVTAVDGIDLHVPEGAVYGFLGPNGAGKTTTLRMLTCLLHPTEGSAEVAGISIENADEIVEHIGYAPAEPPLYDQLTAREQLDYALRMTSDELEAGRERINRLLERFSLQEAADDQIRTYSRGMKQKTNIIQAILHEPSVVIFDEPTQGLDPNMTRELRELLLELTEKGQTILFSTHVLSVAEDIAESVGILTNGGLAAEGPPDEITQDVTGTKESELEDAFVDLTTKQ
ncbi:ABC transporter ATP-binding protein [Halobacteriales archaeon SW_8_65_20]|nr:MAG: ABC transporter ATP-binding protein [Halobacteriales archaeon SW_8_65_20]